jgi:hypothetical protein
LALRKAESERKGKRKRKRIRINRDEIEFTPEGITRAIKESIEIPGELMSSWIGRMAVANATTAKELLENTNRRRLNEGCEKDPVDYRLARAARAVRSALATICQVSETQLQALELREQFPDLPPDWVMQGWPAPTVKPGGCRDCIAEQRAARVPGHLPAEWALAFLAHCPKHLQHLTIGCPNCNAIGRFGFKAASSTLLCSGYG